MKVLVTGANGQLGQDVMMQLEAHKIDHLGTDRDTLDITSETSVRNCMNAYNPDVVIHCAAYTAVDLAESHKDQCYQINVLGTRYLAESAADCGAKFVYISTDYVFDGKGTDAFTVNDQPNPVNYYGETKYQGELEVQHTLNEFFILRISWVFGVYGNNFVKTMLRLGCSRNDISVVSDQVGSPTYTKDVAEMILKMIGTESYGIYHMTNGGFCSWADFATEIFRQSATQCRVHPILTKDYKTEAVRPLNSRMETETTYLKFGMKQRSWQSALGDYLNKMKKEESM